MTHRNFRFLAGAALALLLGAASVPLLDTSTTSAQSGVPQGSTTTFPVLAASAVTSSGLTVLNGDLGVSGKVLNSQLIAPNTVRFTGECGAGCTFTVTVRDNGEPGTLDTFGPSVTGTKNESRSLRVISRGNIQFH